MPSRGVGGGGREIFIICAAAPLLRETFRSSNGAGRVGQHFCTQEALLAKVSTRRERGSAVIVPAIAPPCLRLSIAYFSTTRRVPTPTDTSYENPRRGVSKTTLFGSGTHPPLLVVEKYIRHRKTSTRGCDNPYYNITVNCKRPTEVRGAIYAATVMRQRRKFDMHLLEVRAGVSLEQPDMEILVHHEVKPEVLEASGERGEDGELASERLQAASEQQQCNAHQTPDSRGLKRAPLFTPTSPTTASTSEIWSLSEL